MNELVERIAKAMLNDTDQGDGWAAAEESRREIYRSNARAALIALRETTEAVLWAGVDGWARGASCTMPYGAPRTLAHARRAWESAIDAALDVKGVIDP